MPATVKGKWVLDRHPEDPSGRAYGEVWTRYVNFTMLSGAAFVAIRWLDNRGDGASDSMELVREDGTYWFAYDSYSDDVGIGSEEEAGRTIDFGSEEQTVEEDLYTWLTANATRPAPTVTIKDDVLVAVDVSGDAARLDVLVDGSVVATVEAAEPIFSITGVYTSEACTFEPGMTWADLVDSSYNNGNFSMNAVDGQVQYFSGRIADEDGVGVFPDDLIEAKTYGSYYGW